MKVVPARLHPPGTWRRGVSLAAPTSLSAVAPLAALLAPRRRGGRDGQEAHRELYENRSKLTGKVTSYGVRFRYGGKRRYVTLDAGTRPEAEDAMRHLIADVQRGLWTPPEDRAPQPEVRETPTFAEFASEWFRGRVADGLSEKGQEDVLWRLGHLRSLGQLRLDRIGVEDVDRYRRAKVTEGTLGASSINKTIATLAAVFEVAVEYGYVDRNPAKGKRRRLKAPRPRRVTLTRAEHVAALLDAAGALDAAGRSAAWRRPLLATLTFAGLRIGEALGLRWRDVDLAVGRLRVQGTKTDAADRTVELLPVLRDELATYAAARGVRSREDRRVRLRPGRTDQREQLPQPGPRSGGEDCERAADQDGIEPLPVGLTPHSLRRTFASILVALGRDIAVTMRQMGHTTPHMTLGVYTQAMDWGDGERARLRALVEGRAWINVVEQGGVDLPDGVGIGPTETVVADQEGQSE
jgi:integrase